jgi:hypothetical protein
VKGRLLAACRAARAPGSHPEAQKIACDDGKNPLETVENKGF